MLHALRVFAAAFLAVVALTGARVSAQTHHVLGGDAGSWPSDRVFRVGDKIWFNCSGTEEGIVELEGPKEFHACDLANPIKMYGGDAVELEEEGTRYFTSANLESCKNGLKLPVSVQPHGPPEPAQFPQFGPPEPVYPPPVGPPETHHPPPAFGPPEPHHPPHSFGPPPAFGPPEPHNPPPAFGPPEPHHPPPSFGPPPTFGPPEPHHPPPSFGPPPPSPISAANYLNGPSVLLAGLLVWSMGV